MEESKCDLVIFGATSVVGKLLIEDIFKLLKNMVGDSKRFKLGLAGRNKSELEKVKKEAVERKENSRVDLEIIVATTDDRSSLDEMCSKAKVLINLVGPFVEHGYPVIEACLENGTQYLDVSFEADFQETVLIRYSELAKEKNVFIVMACGFYNFLQDISVQFMKDNFQGKVCSVEMFIDAGGDPKTSILTPKAWECHLYDVSAISRAALLQKVTRSRTTPTLKFPSESRKTVSFFDVTKQWCTQEYHSNNNIIEKSETFFHRINAEDPVGIKTYIILPNPVIAYIYYGYNCLLEYLTMWEFFRFYFIKFYSLSSLGSVHDIVPTRSGNVILYLVTKGWKHNQNTLNSPTETKMLKVETGCGNYGVTSVSMACAAMLMIEGNNLPKRGGVFTPGAVFRSCQYKKYLDLLGIQFTLTDLKK